MRPASVQDSNKISFGPGPSCDVKDGFDALMLALPSGTEEVRLSGKNMFGVNVPLTQDMFSEALTQSPVILLVPRLYVMFCKEGYASAEIEASSVSKLLRSKVICLAFGKSAFDSVYVNNWRPPVSKKYALFVVPPVKMAYIGKDSHP